MNAPGRIARVIDRAAEVPEADWQACAGTANPFASHAFVTSLEDSGSATARAGWRPAHILIDGADGRPAGILAGYLKAHSRGEYVFDHGWADAYERAGGRYYPKLQHATPFTPATAPRLLVRADAPQGTAETLVAAAMTVTVEHGLSSAHATFLTPGDRERFAAAGWMERYDLQFHFLDVGPGGFADLLGMCASRRRKTLRREREQALGSVDEVLWLTGSDLTEAVWDAFWAFYMDTSSRKWGQPYLTRAFFSLVGERMADRIMLVMARKGGRYVAGALNFLGEDCIYGRNWGAVEEIPFLHFELCYHQALDIAAHLGLSRVEAGAQGQHKVQRGYRPVVTRSMHFLPDPGFRDAVARFLASERAAVLREAVHFAELLPFRAGPAAPADRQHAGDGASAAGVA
jgi:predicted N-acyltransferase